MEVNSFESRLSLTSALASVFKVGLQNQLKDLSDFMTLAVVFNEYEVFLQINGDINIMKVNSRKKIW